MPKVIPLFPFCLLLLPGLAIHAQSGCTDPQALNYLPGAATNDGSCLYPVTNYAPLVQAVLPNDLQEISGLTLAGDRWWGHNDGGQPPVFYHLLPETGLLLQEIELKNADNRDWEDLAADDTHLYIGDFGNNYNDRHDLGFYRLPLSAIGANSTEVVENWTFLPFIYTDQTNFNTQPQDSTEYDCEAMILLNGSPHIFSKNWKHRFTTHYLVDTVNGQAQALETFDTQGLITGASLSTDGKLVILLGYDLVGIPKVFCWLLWDWHDGLLFNGHKRRLELGNVFTLGQAEAIGFDSNRAGYLANERVVVNGITILPPRTYAFDVGAWVPQSVATDEAEEEKVRLSPNPFSQTVQLPAFELSQPDFFRVLNALGQVVLESTAVPEVLDTSNWPPGWYVFEWFWPFRRIVASGLKQ